MRFKIFVTTLLAAPVILDASNCFAAGSAAGGLQELIKYGLDHSLDRKSQQLDIQAKEGAAELAHDGKFIPQVAATASVQRILHDDLKPDASGNLGRNDGRDTNYSLTATYDLQKLLGPELKVAAKTTEIAKLQNKLLSRDLIRNIKKAYFQISEIQGELKASEKVIGLFDKVKKILHRQNKMGVYNDIELQQFAVQQSILRTDLESRKTDLDIAFAQLSTLINASVSQTRAMVGDASDFKLPITSSSPRASNIFDSNEIVKSLMSNYDLAKLQYESYESAALPSVYVKVARDLPSYTTSDGPASTGEVGISLPIDSFFTRPKEKSLLGVSAQRENVIATKAVQDYRTQVETDTDTLARLKQQALFIEQTFSASQALLDKSFLYYSQKRLDSLGTLDVFAKFLQASKNRLTNSLQIAVLDAELEYLVGGANQ